jgi:DNA polymerase V
MVFDGKPPGVAGQKGSSKYCKPTSPLRLSDRKASEIASWLKERGKVALSESIAAVYQCDTRTKLELPLQLFPISAGFPSPAEDYIEGKLDLNRFLVDRPAATFFVKAKGYSMIGANIHDGDLLIVDRSLEPIHMNIVIAAIEGEITVKRLHYVNGKPTLVAENDSYKPIVINEYSEFLIWGVVTYVIHCAKLKRQK